MKRAIKTQQNPRKRDNSLIRHTSSSTRQTNFWAAPSSSLNFFLHNTSQKPASSIFLTSKPILTPRNVSQTPYFEPLDRKRSSPLILQSNSYNTGDYGLVLSKENPLSLRENRSKFYHKLPKTAFNDKIATKRLLLDQSLSKSHSNQDKTPLKSLKTFESYEIRPKTNPLSFRLEGNMTKTNEKTFEGVKIKASDIIKPKLMIRKEDLSKEKTPIKLENLFERTNLAQKFKIKTFLTQREEIKQNPPSYSDREVQKRLLIPNLPLQKKQRIILVVENLYLSDCRTKNNLKYCYLSLQTPLSTCILSGDLIEAEFKEVLLVLKEKFHINSKDLYLFLKTGKEIKSHYEIPFSEKTVFLSSSRAFQGVNSILQKSHTQGFSLMKILYRLEKPLMNQDLINVSPIAMDSHVKKHYGDVIEDVIKLLGDEGEGSEALERRNRLFKRNNTFINNDIRKEKGNSRLVFKDKKEYLEDNSNPMIYSRKYGDISKICKLYKGGHEDIIFNKNERDDNEGEEGMLKELEQMRSLEEKG